MKLHLPLSLRSALLAVLVSLSFAQAGETIIVNSHQEKTLEERIYEDLTLYIEENGILHISSDSTWLTGNNNITIAGNLFIGGYIGMVNYSHFSDITTNIIVKEGGMISVEGRDSYIGYIYKSTNNNVTTLITVEEGGTFQMNGRESHISHIDSESYNNIINTSITVKDGAIFDVGTGEIGYLSGYSNEMITTVTVGESATFIGSVGCGSVYEGKMTTTVTVEAGGTFNGSVGNVRAENGGETTTTVTVEARGTFSGSVGNASDGGEATTTVTIEAGGTFSGFVDNSSDGGEATTTVTVEAGGTFSGSVGNASDGGEAATMVTVEAGGTFSGSVGNVSAENGGKTTTTITMSGGTFNGSVGNMGCHYSETTTTITMSGGSAFYLDGNISRVLSAWESKMTTSIMVTEGSIFNMGSGSIGVINKSVNSIGDDSMYYSEMTTMITVAEGGIFNMDGSASIIGCMHMIDDDNDRYSEIVTSIVVGDGGVFNMSEGSIGHTVFYGIINSYNSIETDITVQEGGNFNMDGGFIGYLRYISRKGDVIWGGSPYEQNDVKATITVEGNFVMNGGYIAWSESNEYDMNVDVVVKGNGKFTYKGGTLGNGAAFTVKEMGSIDWSDQDVDRSVIMEGGSMLNATKYAGELRIVSDKAFVGDIYLGKVNAARISQIQTGNGVTISGMIGELTIHSGDYMYVGADSIGRVGETEKSTMITFAWGKKSVTFADTITLNFDRSSFDNIERDEKGIATFEIWFANCQLRGSDIYYFALEDDWDMWIDENASKASMLEGKLIVKGKFDDVWFADAHVGTDGEFGDENTLPGNFYNKIVVNRDAHLTLNRDIQLNHLEGTHDLIIDGTGDVSIHNQRENTEYEGNITISCGDLHKTGEGVFTMMGNLIATKVRVQEGSLILAAGGTSAIGELEGKVVVKGELKLTGNSPLAEVENHGALALVGADVGVMEQKAINMLNGSQLHLRAGGDTATAQTGANVRVSENMIFRARSTTTLTLNMNSAELWDSASALSLSANGQIFIEKGAEFVLNALQEALPDGHVESLKNVTVMRGQSINLVDVFTDEMLTLATLAGGENGTTIDVRLSGLFDLYYSDASLTLQDNELLLNATLKEEYVSNDNEDGNGDNGELGDGELGDGELGDGELGDGELGDGELGDGELGDGELGDGELGDGELGDGELGDGELGDGELGDGELGDGELGDGELGDGNNGQNSGQGGSGGQGNHEPKLGFFEAAVDSGNSSTAQAGGGMLDSVNLLTTDATLIGLGDALVEMINDGQKAQAAKVMAAVAGGAVTALGSAQREAMRERMSRARAQAEQGYYVPQDKKLHTWIEAAASYAKVSADADESGYKLDSWGGSVGVDYAVSSEFTLGLTLTAMYGDLTAEATEQAEGKLDAYYVSLWAHKQSARWGHSFLVMVSTSDATLDRTVNYGTGAYTAQGCTSGSGYGAMYELTYDIPLSETSFWQPLMSVSMVSTSMDAYNETGAEGAGLAVGEQEQTVTTVSLGARWVSRAGADIFGSTAVVELSARVAQDMGDTRSEAENALLANPGYTRKVQGAEVGSTAVQIGAGLAIPTGKAAQLYLNANADLRSNATNWNMGAGIRFSF